jgi:HD-like signal output (HDOD) protein
MYQAEEDILGITHADLGAWLFERWNLAKGIIETTKFHHNPMLATSHQKVACIVHFSDIITRAIMFGSGGDRKIPILSETAWQILGLREMDLERIILETFDELEKALIFLEFIK